MNKNVLFVIANEGYQPIEYGIPKKILEAAGITVTTASDLPTLAIASDNSTTKVDLIINEVDIKNYQALIIIGGPGALDHLDNEAVYALIKAADKKKIIIGAICIAPRILAKTALLKGKKATGWNDDNELANIFDKAAINYVPENVVVDGRYITAVGPQAAEAFGNQLINLL